MTVKKEEKQKFPCEITVKAAVFASFCLLIYVPAIILQFYIFLLCSFSILKHLHC